MGRRTILRQEEASRHWLIRSSSRERGWSLIEMTITLSLLMAIALFGMKTMVSAWTLQNWSIYQSMTDAYAGIETASAQRWLFASFPDPRWPVYPLSATTTPVTIGQTPTLLVTASVVRTCHQYQDPVTGSVSYLLESYVVYKNGPRNYCKVSKVYRAE